MEKKEKNALISLIMGIISLCYLFLIGGLTISLFIGGPSAERLAKKTEIFTKILVMFNSNSIFIWGLFFSFFGCIGLIFGILGLKSTKQKIAICGIVFSLISLIIIVGFNFLFYILLPMTF